MIGRTAGATYLLAALGCASVACGQAVRAVPEQAQAGRSFDELAEAFRDAHARQDSDAARALVHPPGLDYGPQELFDGGFRHDLPFPIASIVFERLKPGEKLEYRLGGKTWRPTMRPSGWLVVNFAEPPGGTRDGFRLTQSRYLVGVANNRYGIVLAAPVTP